LKQQINSKNLKKTWFDAASVTNTYLYQYITITNAAARRTAAPGTTTVVGSLARVAAAKSRSPDAAQLGQGPCAGHNSSISHCTWKHPGCASFA
jgi:hypothetical protein